MHLSKDTDPNPLELITCSGAQATEHKDVSSDAHHSETLDVQSKLLDDGVVQMIKASKCKFKPSLRHWQKEMLKILNGKC